MRRTNWLRCGLVFILAGIIIGLVISAGLNWTTRSQANARPEVVPGESEDPPGLEINSDIQALEQLSDAFAEVAENVTPSVVTIFTETVKKIPDTPFRDFFGDEFFRQFFGIPPEGQKEYHQYGLGSGVIVSSDGIILTNNHVIKGADDIQVRLIDGTEYNAEIKGKDERTDLAVLKIDAKNLKPIKFGDSDKMRVGAWVLAIGSPLSPELAHTVTSGIISAKGRSGIGLVTGYEDFIQTDAAINPGNSGGALVNLRGELIGINTAIATKTGGFMGIGFAIPSNLAKKVMTDILEKGRVIRGYLGVLIQDIDKKLQKVFDLKSTNGVLISEVKEGSPADKAGLKEGDVVIKFNNRRVKNSIELSTLVASAGPNTEVTLTVIRDGKEKDIKVVLGEYPEGEEPIAAHDVSTNIGIEVANITSDLVNQFDLKIKKNGVVIIGVERGSPAAQAGLRPGDVILKINRKPVKNLKDYNKIMDNIKKGDTLLFYVQRGEGKLFIAFTLPE